MYYKLNALTQLLNAVWYIIKSGSIFETVPLKMNMKKITPFLLAGAAAGITVWFLNTEKGKRFIDVTLKDFANDLASQLKSKIKKAKSTADSIAEEGLEYVDDVNEAVQEA